MKWFGKSKVPNFELMNQGKTFWLTGLSGAGKTTLATALSNHYRKKGKVTFLLDGDELRSTISVDLGFTDKDRLEQNRRAASMANLLNQQGIVVFAALISPTELIRSEIKNQLSSDHVHFIYVQCSLAECMKRDVKHLYINQEQNPTANFTGIHQPFEDPIDPWLQINTENFAFDDCLNSIIDNIDSILLK